MSKNLSVLRNEIVSLNTEQVPTYHGEDGMNMQSIIMFPHFPVLHFSCVQYSLCMYHIVIKFKK